MCRRISHVGDGPDLGYQPYRAYIFSFDGSVEITERGYEIECWEKGAWINMGKTVAVEKGCPFRVVRKKEIEPAPHCTTIDIEQVKVAA